MARWSDEAARTLKGTAYPLPPEGSDYVRTGQLANRWRTRRTKKTRRVVEYAIENKARGKRGQAYSSFVVGNEEGAQAWMHKGRWWRARAVVERRLERLVRILRHAIRNKAKELGL